jgi:hypothetical protein
MDQQSVVMCPSLKGLNTVELHNDLVATLKGEAKFYDTVKYTLRKPSFSNPKIAQPSESSAPICILSQMVCLAHERNKYSLDLKHCPIAQNYFKETDLSKITKSLMFRQKIPRKKQSHLIGRQKEAIWLGEVFIVEANVIVVHHSKNSSFSSENTTSTHP